MSAHSVCLKSFSLGMPCRPPPGASAPSGRRADRRRCDKNHSHSIDMVRLQCSGNAHGLIKGIGMVNCLYVNSDSGQYWIADYKLFDPDGDGKTKLDHVRDMLISLVASKAIPFDRVLVDSWYVCKDLMLFIESLGKIY